MPTFKGLIAGIAIGTALAGGAVSMGAMTTAASASTSVLAVDSCTNSHRFHHHGRGNLRITVINNNCTRNDNKNSERVED